MPEKYRPSKLSLDEAGLLRDFVRPYFEQRSTSIKAGDIVEIRKVKFKVITTRPAAGGGVGKETELACQGVALKESFQPTRAAASRPKAAAKTAAAKAAAREESQQCQLM